MFRSLFLAVGAYCLLLGVEALALEKAVLKRPENGTQSIITQQEIVPPPWVPWSLLAGGAVVVIYSFTIPRRVRKD